MSYHTGHHVKGSVPLLSTAKSCNTHHAAAHEDHHEGLEGAGRAHDPGQTDEEDDAEDVLDARQEHAQHRAWNAAGTDVSCVTGSTQSAATVTVAGNGNDKFIRFTSAL